MVKHVALVMCMLVAASTELAAGRVLSAAAPAAAATCGPGPTWGPVDAAIPDGAPCSLRDILESQVADGDTVVLASGATYVIDDGGASLCADRSIDVDSSVTIAGHGATLLVDCLAVDANALNIDAPGVTIDDVTITTNPGKGGNGAINLFDDGFTITNSTIVDNVNCSYVGGGITSKTFGARVVNTTIARNSAFLAGGGIGVGATGTVSLDVVNSTVTDNRAELFGGGIAVNGPLSLIYSDVVDNGIALLPSVCTGGGWPRPGSTRSVRARSKRSRCRRRTCSSSRSASRRPARWRPSPPSSRAPRAGRTVVAQVRSRSRTRSQRVTTSPTTPPAASRVTATARTPAIRNSARWPRTAVRRPPGCRRRPRPCSARCPSTVARRTAPPVSPPTSAASPAPRVLPATPVRSR